MLYNQLEDILRNMGGEAMDIQRIEIKGFKNITSTSLQFDRITTLIGLNGCGKSNIIDAIDFGWDFIHAPNKLKSRLMGIKANIPILKTNAGVDYSFLVEATHEKKGVVYSVEYSFSFSWAKNDNEGKINTEVLRIKKLEKGQKYNTFISRKGLNAEYKSSETGRCDHRISILSNGLVFNKLLALDDLFYLDILQSFDNTAFYVDRHLDASESYSPDPVMMKSSTGLDLYSVNNIPRVVYLLKNEHPQHYERLLSAFMQLFPDITKIGVEELKLDQAALSSIALPESLPIIYSDSIYIMNVIDKRLAQPLLFDKLSDGTKRIFLMFTYAILADIRGLSMIAIEEPENTIHPKLLQSFLSIITQLVDNSKIIITSHSPYMLQYIHPSWIYVCVPTGDGHVDFRKISKINLLVKDSVEFDVSVGDYLFGLLASNDAADALLEYVEK